MFIVISEKLLDIFTCVKRLSFFLKTEFPSIKFIDLNLLCADSYPIPNQKNGIFE